MTNTYGILEWTNEHSLSGYPLTRSFAPNDFIVDASFVQFDGFVPVLKTLLVSQTKIVLTITTDAGDVAVPVSKPISSYFPGQTVAVVAGDRQLGYLVFGQGLPAIFSLHLDTLLKLNIPFSPGVVRGVSSRAGVFSITGYDQSVNIRTGDSATSRSIFFDLAGNLVTWNAGWLDSKDERTPLKTLNGMTPVNNAVFIQDSDIIKVTPQGDTVLVRVAVPVGHSVISPVTTYE